MDPNERLDTSDMDQEAIQSDRAVDLLAQNKQQVEKIAELEQERIRLNKEIAGLESCALKHNKKLAVSQEQIAAIGQDIDKLHMHNRETFEQIWNSLKMVKIYL